MAAHVYFNDQTQFGRLLRRALQMSEESDDLVGRVRDTMLQMREGDGTLPEHYAEVATRFGFETPAKAKDAFEQIDFAYTKTNGKRTTLYAKLRG